ncbi:MAG: hypothetical protein FK730_13920 [Asgard group archaeon]|nr:hypothetical protein [Asgard group archaeon]
MSIIVGIGIIFLVVLESEGLLCTFLGIFFIVSGLAFPFVNLITGKRTFEYKRKKPIPVRKKKETKFNDGLVEAYDKDTLAYTVKSKFQY